MSVATQFLEAIVPDNGLVCIAHSRDIPARGRAKKPWTHDFFTPEQVRNGVFQEHLAKLNEHKDTNVYTAVASFSARKRDRGHVEGLKCVLLDIDLKGDRAHYKSKSEAVLGLSKLYKEVQCLPKPWIVDSGNGIHAYFVFTDAVSQDEWFPVANTFAKVAEHVDPRLLADPAPTKDAARVMRLPSTWNAKKAKREFARVMQTGEPAKFQDMKMGLAREASTRNVWVSTLVPEDVPLLDKPTPTHGVGVNKNIGGGFVDGTITFTNLNPKPILAGCAQMRHMAKVRGDVAEPEWTLMLRVLNTCQRADELVHTFSNGHASYTRNGTINKLRHVRNNFAAPSAGCEEFRQFNPKRCQGCKFRDKVWTPSQIGEFAKQKEDRQTQAKEATDKLVKGNTTKQGFLPLPAYYRQAWVNETKQPITTLPVYQNEDDGETHEPLIKGHINVIGSSQRVEYLYDGEKKTSQTMVHMEVTTWSRTHVVSVPFTTLTEDRVNIVTKPLREIGVGFRYDTQKESKALRTYFAKVAEVATHRPVPYFHTKGWAGDGLVLGAKQFRPNNKTTLGYTYAEHMRANQSNIERFCSGHAKGSLTEWRRGMQVFDGDHPHAHLLILSGIANILFPLMSDMQGGILLALTGKSGTGKTSLIQYMNSLLGHPTEGVIQGASTEMVLLETMKQASVFMLPIDDVTNMSPKGLSQMLAVVTSGRPRQRLEHQTDGTWAASQAQTLNASVMLTSNYSADSVFTSGGKKEDALQLEAAMTRLLEIPGSDTFVDGVSPEQWRVSKRRIQANYGHVLAPFARYVVDNKQMVTDLLERNAQWFSNQMRKQLVYNQQGGQGQHRFWVRYLAAVMTAGKIAKDLGFIAWNLTSVARVGIELAIGQHEATEEAQEDDMEVLWDLLTDDDNGKINIALSSYEVDLAQCGSWPNWKADNDKSRTKQWTERQGSGMSFNNMSGTLNTPEWRVGVIEASRKGVPTHIERRVWIPLRQLNAVIRESRDLSATTWEELYGSITQSGAVVRGVQDGKPSKQTGLRKRIKSHASRCVEIVFPPIPA